MIILISIFRLLLVMCLSPVKIINPNKYVSIRHRDRFLLSVPCGLCAECQARISSQWQFRTYVEFQDLVQSGTHYCYFDTLTYDEKSLPRMCDVLPTELSYACFNHRHITLFLKKLRVRLMRKFGVGIRYFLSSEYGEVHHRPHYHILVFCPNLVSPLQLSSLISETWQYGRTDGFPYKSAYYVTTHNTITQNIDGEIFRAINYVTKYVQKSCTYQDELNKRIEMFMSEMFDELEEDLFKSQYDFLFSAAKRVVNQFHLQSLHYGESALSSFDIDDLIKNNSVVMPDKDFVVKRVSLADYYKRKLFYTLVEVDGAKTWQLTDFGKEYKSRREKYLEKDMIDRFSAYKIQYHLDYNVDKLVDYIMHRQGRIKGNLPQSTLIERLPDVSFFNYSTRTDKFHFGSRGISSVFLGNSYIGYDDISLLFSPFTSFVQFIHDYVYEEKEYEDILSLIASYNQSYNKGKQSLFANKQRLRSLIKEFI